MTGWSLGSRYDHGRSAHARNHERLDQGGLPHLLGISVTACSPGRVTGRLPVKPELVAGNGALWAPAIVALADTLCAYGVSTKWPDGASGFTTVELKCNFMGTLRDGAILGEATLLHGGRTTQVWDAMVTNEATGKLVAAFRCTQIILYPRGTWRDA
jgi:1,4-dihydroxy-2-naphthoyl-CoA hydrolase